MSKKSKKKLIGIIIAFIIAAGAWFTNESGIINDLSIPQVSEVSTKDIPQYEGNIYVEVNGNIPEFSEEDVERLSVPGYEYYSALDSLGRARTVEACVGEETMPTGERSSIGMIKPSGWHTVRYDFVDGKYLYNRCHLLGWQLTGENANESNLITGTRSLNVEGMLQFENDVAEYIKVTGNHVSMRVTPTYEGNNLLASGVKMEAKSVEDEGLEFNVFIFNVEDGVHIDYSTGENYAE